MLAAKFEWDEDIRQKFIKGSIYLYDKWRAIEQGILLL